MKHKCKEFIRVINGVQHISCIKCEKEYSKTQTKWHEQLITVST